ncbi:MAG: moaA 3 [Firmicutes bacterium]|nr:moaA 3 [Bacillota bacterium]
MLDSYDRKIEYLRVSVTDRCNLRCRYCMPDEGIASESHSDILTLEQIARLVKVSTQVGISKVRFTGGEPLVRKDITKLIAQVAEIPQITDIAITTNGILFDGMAEDLKAAGLNRVNFSLDSFVPEKFNYITRRGNLHDVTRAIEKALKLDLAPVKINTVVMKGFNDDEILDFAKLAYDMPLNVRFIEFMPVGDLPFFKKERLVSMAEIRQVVETRYELFKAPIAKGNGPAKSFRIKGGAGTIGFISAMSNHFCSECNRIRMTADGKLRGCLFDKGEVNLKLALENNASDEEIARLFSETIRKKPDRHHMDEGWGTGNRRKMYQIGG